MHSICIRNRLHFSPINLAATLKGNPPLQFPPCHSPFCASCTLCAPATFADCGFSPLFSFIHANIFNKFSFCFSPSAASLTRSSIKMQCVPHVHLPLPAIEQYACYIRQAREGSGGVTAVVCLECNAIASRAYSNFFYPQQTFFFLYCN